EKLIVRKSELYDGAYPSGNSAATMSLIRLSKFTAEARFEDIAMATLEKLSGNLDRSPGGYTYLLCALDFAFGPIQEFVVTGDDKLASLLAHKLSSRKLFRSIVHWRKGDEKTDQIFAFL